MYRILIADDEGLMLEAFKSIILAEFGKMQYERQLKQESGNPRKRNLSPQILCL